MARCEEQCSRISTYQLVYTAGGSVPKNFISYSIHEQKTIVHISEEWVNCRDKCFTLLSMSTKSYSMTRSTFSGFRDRHRIRVVREDKKVGNSITTTTTFCNIERFWMLTSAWQEIPFLSASFHIPRTSKEEHNTSKTTTAHVSFDSSQKHVRWGNLF